MGTEKGQALTELAIGMFALVLVVSALSTFVVYIVKGLDAEREIRAEAGKDALQTSDMSDNPILKFADRVEPIEVDSISAEYLFGTSKVEVRESVYLPPMRGL